MYASVSTYEFGASLFKYTSRPYVISHTNMSDICKHI